MSAESVNMIKGTSWGTVEAISSVSATVSAAADLAQLQRTCHETRSLSFVAFSSQLASDTLRLDKGHSPLLRLITRPTTTTSPFQT